MKRLCQLLLVFWLSSLCALAQDAAVWTLSGKVTDAKTRKPMAHVSVTDRNVGTVTNEMGEFVLKLPKAPERVAFSCLGYKT